MSESREGVPDLENDFWEDQAGLQKRRRVKQVIYIYEDEDSMNSEPVKDNNAPTTVVCCCHEHKPKEVSPMNPRIGLPGPIALFGFGTTVALANTAVAGLVDHNAYMDCMAIFMGGMVQFVCGYFELINKNTVGCIICTGYGAYNLILGCSGLLPPSGVVNNTFMGSFFFVWMFYALTVCLMCLKGPIVGTVMNILVVINFFFCAVGNWANNTSIQHFAGFEGIVVGTLAVYLGMAFSLSAAYGRNILPLGFHQNFKNFSW